MKSSITIGLVGAGTGAALEMSALKRVYGIDMRYKTVVAHRPEQLLPFAEQFGFERTAYDYAELLQDSEINTICICTPPYAHEDMILKALQAGKSVICEKPFIGYFGEPDDPQPVGKAVSKQKMYDTLLKKMERITATARESGVTFCYADNAVYAPAIQKAAEVIRAKKSRILYMKGEESLKGSSSAVANDWDKTGGGTFIRNATHPMAAVLWLKQQEAKAHDESIYMKSIFADMGIVTPNLSDYEHRHIDARPNDVEDSGTSIITFSDDSKALVFSTNTYLGGLIDYVEVYCNDATFVCNLTQHDALNTYFLDNDGMQNIQLSYLLPKMVGWNHAQICDEMIRGYMNEMQDFMEAISFGREPLSGLQLATDTMKAIYAAYLSDQKGKRVVF